MSQENPISKQPLIRHVNRQQMSWRAVDVEHLISEDHPARAIWTLVGRLNLSAFYQAIESSTEEGGRPAIDPQLLISMWVYAYSQGIGSAREVARRCEYDPAFQWLTGLQEVNYHTLADFRVEKQQELDELFTQVLGALSKEGLITLEQVMQDGTKIKALASSRSYLQEETIREHLEKARRRVTEMGDPRNEESSSKVKQARVRARREQQERLEGALEELKKWQARKSGEKAKRETRVSTSDPQARVMKHPDKGFALSYNAQISTDAAHGLIVGVAVTQEANDMAQLLPAVDRVEQRLEKRPQQMVADSGYTTREIDRARPGDACRSSFSPFRSTLIPLRAPRREKRRWRRSPRPVLRRYWFCRFGRARSRGRQRRRRPRSRRPANWAYPATYTMLILSEASLSSMESRPSSMAVQNCTLTGYSRRHGATKGTQAMLRFCRCWTSIMSPGPCSCRKPRRSKSWADRKPGAKPSRTTIRFCSPEIKYYSYEAEAVARGALDSRRILPVDRLRSDADRAADRAAWVPAKRRSRGLVLSGGWGLGSERSCPQHHSDEQPQTSRPKQDQSAGQRTERLVNKPIQKRVLDLDQKEPRQQKRS